MDLIGLFLGMILLTIGLVITDFGTLLRMLGFREESQAVLKDALAITVLGFALLMTSQQPVVIKPPSWNVAQLD